MKTGLLLISLLNQMLFFLDTLIDTAKNNVLLSSWASLWLIKLTDKLTITVYNRHMCVKHDKI